MNCGREIKGEESFDVLAEQNGWFKRGIHYICDTCEKPKEKVTRPARKLFTRDIKNTTDDAGDEDNEKYTV